MGSFNWHDEETGWDVVEKSAGNDPSQGSNNPSRPWRGWLLGLLIIVIGVAAWAAFWRVNSVEEELEQKVLESWEIILSSEKEQDVELFTNQLSGRDTDWIRLQQNLTKDQKLSGRAAILPSLQRLSVDQVDENPEITFSPDLTEAILSHQVQYVDKWGREITLMQEEIFRLGADRWLLAPPGPLHWTALDAESENAETQRYSDRFAYDSVPVTDFDIADQMVAWIENRLNTLCAEGLFDACQTEQTPQISILFFPNISTQMLEGRFQFEATDLEITLPAPALIGRPVSDEDAQFLVEAYGEIFFERYLIVLMDQRGVPADPMSEAIINFAVTQVGGISPLTPADYQRVWLEIEDVKIAFNQNRVVGEGTGNIRQFMDIPVRSTFRLMVEYRMQESGLTAQSLLDQQRAIQNGPFFPEILLRADEWDAFSRFVENRAALASVPNKGNTAAVD